MLTFVVIPSERSDEGYLLGTRGWQEAGTFETIRSNEAFAG